MALIGDLASQVWELVRLAGWRLELEKLMPSMQEASAEDEEAESDRTGGESPCVSTPRSRTPGSGADNSEDSDYEQEDKQRAPRRGRKGTEESPSVGSNSDNALEHARQKFDKLHILNSSGEEDRHNSR